MAAKKCKKKINQGKTSEWVFFNERKRAEIKDPDSVVKEINEHDSVQDKQMFFEKRHSMVWYAMLWYPMLWYGM